MTYLPRPVTGSTSPKRHLESTGRNGKRHGGCCKVGRGAGSRRSQIGTADIFGLTFFERDVLPARCGPAQDRKQG